MKTIKPVYILLLATLFLSGCGEDKTNSKMDDAKQHLIDAGKNIKAAGSDIKEAAEPKLKKLKTDTEQMLNKAKTKAGELTQQGGQAIEKMKDKTQKMMNDMSGDNQSNSSQ